MIIKVLFDISIIETKCHYKNRQIGEGTVLDMLYKADFKEMMIMVTLQVKYLAI